MTLGSDKIMWCLNSKSEENYEDQEWHANDFEDNIGSIRLFKTFKIIV